jgi:hypothetical protein
MANVETHFSTFALRQVSHTTSSPHARTYRSKRRSHSRQTYS